MARRASMALLGTGIGLTVLLPVVGVLIMVMAAVALAITLERDLPRQERTGRRRPISAGRGGRVSGRPSGATR